MADVFLNREKDDEGRAAWAAYCVKNPEKSAMLLEQVESYAQKVSAKTKKKPAAPKEIKGSKE